MSFWKKKKANQVGAPSAEVLYLTEEGENSPVAAYGPPSVSGAELEALLLKDLPSQPLSCPVNSAEPPAGDSPRGDNPPVEAGAIELVTESEMTSEPPRPASPKKASSEKSNARKRSEIEKWRRGHKGRPIQMFVGFLPSSTKADAVKYAVGVAEQNATNSVNAAYAVFAWNDGWAYEVHEGGPMRAYLPTVLKYFDAQGDTGKLEDLIITITTSRRAVRIERTHGGLTGFLMPEAFVAEQSPWLEPGSKLKPAVPVRLGVLGFGGAIFSTGFLAMILALAQRPDPQPLPSKQNQEIRFEQLPLSQWPTLLAAASTGYVDRLEYLNGKWQISRASNQVNAPAAALPPPLPTPLQGKP